MGGWCVAMSARNQKSEWLEKSPSDGSPFPRLGAAAALDDRRLSINEELLGGPGAHVMEFGLKTWRPEDAVEF